MTPLSPRSTPGPRPRRTRLRRAVGGLGVVAALTVGFLAALAAHLLASTSCPGFEGEGYVFAPRSTTGRIVCSGSEGVSFWVDTLPVVSVMLAVVTIAMWVERVRTRWVAVATAVATLGPLAMMIVIGVGPGASCTKTQWDEYGALGCERNVELRFEIPGGV